MARTEIRIVVVAPVLAVRAGLRALLAEGEASGIPRLEVIDEAASLADLGLIPVETDVLLVVEEAGSREDLRQMLLPRQSQIALLLLTDDPEASRFLVGLPLRAWGVLPMDTSAEELEAALRALHEGLLVGARPLLEPLLPRLLSSSAEEAGSLVESLTERESEVLQLLAQGMANKQIALSLGISEHTVKFHVSSIYTKLGATNRTEAVRLGVQRGLVLL